MPEGELLAIGPPPGLCAFCRRGPLTIEEVFPKWLAELLPQNKPVTGILADPMEGTILRTSGGVAYAAQARCVCSTCNSGWMSQLEGEAKPLIGPMVVGKAAIAMMAESQTLLARWALKTALMVQYLQPQVLIPERFYTSFHRRGLPSSNGRVWLASYDGKSIPSGHHSYLLDVSGTTPSGEVHRGNAFGVTFHVDKLVLQVFDHDLPGELGLRFPQSVGQQFDGAVLPIWPAGRTRSWPPSRRLDEPGLNALKRAFDALADQAQTAPRFLAL